MSVTIAMTLENYGISQFTNYNFDSIFKIGNKAYGVNSDGIYYLCAEDDAGEDIDAYIKTRTMDFETQTRLRNFYIGYEADADLTLEVVSDETVTTTHTLETKKSGTVSQGARTRLHHTQIGRYFAFKLSNTAGEHFTIDSIEVTPRIQQLKPRG